MRLAAFTPSFQDYEYDLDYYHGKDVMHEGNLLKLDPEYSWDRISKKTRSKIRKSKGLNIEFRRVKGTKQDIKDFRTIWFDPTDDTLPEKLNDDEVMYLAYSGEELIGGVILTPASPTVLYLHNLGSSITGKAYNLPTLLLWHLVEDLASTKWQYIDVGVSFRPTLYAFFRNWKVKSYPIIFSPPFISPDIRLTPFTANNIVSYEDNGTTENQEIIRQYFGDTYTILPRAINCIVAVLQYLGLNKDDNVAVYKTFNDNDYISGCVSKPIERVSHMVREIDSNTKAVIVIHEFGYPYKDIWELKKICKEKKIPLIEDCAWGYGSKIDEHTKIGDVGEYAIFSFTKFLPMQYGAIIKGLEIADDDNWSNYRMLDFYKREIIVKALKEHLPKMEEYNEMRRKNWLHLDELFRLDGYEPLAKLEEGTYPAVYISVLSDLESVFKRYEEFGVETGRYYPAQANFLPIHQLLNDKQLDYIYAVHRGLLNLCSNYQRGGKK